MSAEPVTGPSSIPPTVKPVVTPQEVVAKDNSNPNKPFQIMLVSQFLQPLFEDTSKSMFSDGVTGDLYKSQFAQALAEIIVTRGGIGLGQLSGTPTNMMPAAHE